MIILINITGNRWFYICLVKQFNNCNCCSYDRSMLSSALCIFAYYMVYLSVSEYLKENLRKKKHLNFTLLKTGVPNFLLQITRLSYTRSQGHERGWHVCSCDVLIIWVERSFMFLMNYDTCNNQICSHAHDCRKKTLL